MPKGSGVYHNPREIDPMKYFTYKQSSISDFFHSFDNTKSQITYDSLVTSTDGCKYKVPCQINNFFYSRYRQSYSRRTDPYNSWWILRIAREQILRELIVWEIVFDAKSLRSGIFFEQKTETYGPLSL